MQTTLGNMSVVDDMLVRARTQPAAVTAIDRWLKSEVATAYDDLNAHPDSAIPIAKVKENISRRRGKADEPSSLTGREVGFRQTPFGTIP